MKIYFKRLVLVLILVSSSVILPKHLFAQQANVSFQVFYDQLSPYGQWVDYKNYGYVWMPDVGTDFVPYATSGYWVLTDYGWTWVSDYEWGWAPFHYGRWDFDNYYGWLWVPDTEWGPSWVNWRSADGYYGWSPMEPGISLAISFGRSYNSYNDHWTFVRDRDFERRDIFRYSVNRSDHSRIISNSRVINGTYLDRSRNTTYVTGPAREDVQKVIGRRLNPVAIQENNRPGKDQNDGRLKMYRPQVVNDRQLERKPAPTRVENLKNVKRPAERTSVTNKERLQQNQQINSPQQNKNFSQPSQQPQKVAPAGNKERQPQNNIPRQQNNVVRPVQQPKAEPKSQSQPQRQQQQQDLQRQQQQNQLEQQRQQPQPQQRQQPQQPQQQRQPQQQQQQRQPQPQQQQRQPQQKAVPERNERPQQNNSRPQQQNEKRSNEEKKPTN